MTKAYARNEDDISLLEQQVAAAVDKRTQMNSAEEDPEITQANLDAENPELNEDERVWAKRYSDLRRHTASKSEESDTLSKEWQQRAQDAEEKLDVLNKPISDDQLEEVRKDFPEVAGMVEAIAIQKAEEAAKRTADRLADKITALEKDKLELAKDRTIAQVKIVHPDFDELSQDPKFHDWVAARGKDNWIFKTIYGTEAFNSRDAIDAIRLYKNESSVEQTDTELSKKAEKAAAKAVSRNKSQPTPTKKGPKVIRTSELTKMNNPNAFKTVEDFEAFIEEVDLARREGRLVVDT